MHNLSYIVGHLHDLAEGCDGKFVVTAFGEGKSNIIRHFAVGDVNSHVQSAKELSEKSGYNIYMSLSLMRSDLPASSKGKEEDISSVLGFVCDFDDGLGREYTTRTQYKPSYVLETSPNNAQCFYLFDKPFKIENENSLKFIKHCAENLTSITEGSDSCGADLSHVWRLPETFNVPNEKKLIQGRNPEPFAVHLLESSMKPSLTIEKLAELSARVPIKEDTVKSLELEYLKPVSLEELSDYNQLVSKIISPTESGKRSEAVASVVASLLSMGHGSRDIYDLFCNHRDGIAERYNGDQNRMQDDILRLASKFSKDTVKIEEGESYSLSPFEAFNECDLPSREFLFGDKLLAKKLSVLVAAPGVGKSTLSLTIALSLATGRNLIGIEPAKRCKVALINNEDDIEEMQRRFLAIMKHFRIDFADIEEWLHFQSGENVDFKIAKKEGNTKEIVPHHKNDLRDYCIKHKIEALFVDPFLETHEADENDNRQTNEVCKIYRQLAQEANLAILLIHHTRKQQGASSAGHYGNMDSARGASSLLGAARIVFTLYAMEKKDAEKCGIAEEDRHYYMRMDDAKGNMSLISDKPHWFRKQSVLLANGDNVGVVEYAPDIEDKKVKLETRNQSRILFLVREDPIFEELRNKGRFKLGDFIIAIKAVGFYFGDETQTRSTLEGRIKKALEGNGINNGEFKLYHKQNAANRHYIHLDWLEESDNANSPNISAKRSGNSASIALESKVPQAAKDYVAKNSKAKCFSNATMPIPIRESRQNGSPS